MFNIFLLLFCEKCPISHPITHNRDFIFQQWNKYKVSFLLLSEVLSISKLKMRLSNIFPILKIASLFNTNFIQFFLNYITNIFHHIHLISTDGEISTCTVLM